MVILQEAVVFVKARMSNMTTSHRVTPSREVKRLVLAINETYKRTKGCKLNGCNEVINR